jgi:hypothetical protein
MPVNPYRKGGADVFITDGGTSASVASTALTNLGATLGGVLDTGNTTSGTDIVISGGDSITGTGSIALTGATTLSYLNLGLTTGAGATGDIAAGALAAGGRFVYDHSANTISLYESSAGALQTTIAFDTALATTSQDIIGAINEINAGVGAGSLTAVLAVGDTTSGQNILITSGDNIDSETAVPLVIGPATATAVTVGASDIATNMPGWSNTGAATAAVALGDLAAGDGTNEMLWDASAGALQINNTPTTVAIADEFEMIANEGVSHRLRTFHISAPSSTTWMRYRGTAASPTAVQSGDTIGQLAFQGSWGTSIASINSGARMRVVTDGNWTVSSTPASIRFDTVPTGGVNPLERMRINQ